MTGFISSPRFVEHDTGAWHPEQPDRIRAIHRAIRAAGMVDSPDPFPDFELNLGPISGDGVRLLEIAPRRAREEDVLRVHPPEHLKRIRHVCEVGGGVLDQGDTPVCKESYEIAMLSLGAVLEGCDAVMDGRAARVFVASRPPGHHAEPDRAMGFCLFSNIAIGARYLQQRWGLQRVAIVDFDVHHGNGTQMAFDNDPSVLMVSMHQHPRTCYPGSGYDWEIGVGAGRGTTINIAFEPGSDDARYLDVLKTRIVPAVEKFAPQALMISAGFDAHAEDPLANMALSEKGYEAITGELVALANRVCGGKIISVLEGGYNLRALGRSVVRHLVALHNGLAK